jgi:L-threonylcarbamoyladenylate synthase
MKIIKLKEKNHQKIISEALKVLKSGGLIIYPTETCYGAGVDPTNQKAVDKLITYKKRRQGKPMAIAVACQKMAEKFVDLSTQAQNFYKNFLPGPYCIISNCHSNNKIVDGIKSEFNTLGIRIPKFPFILNLLKQFDNPITTTSANASYKKTPYCIDDILNNLSEKQKNLIDLIIDAGKLEKKPTSLVVDTSASIPIFIRSNESQREQFLKTEKINQNHLSFITNNQTKTKNLAKRLMLKFFTQYEQKGIVFGLDGELGVGKTIFAKGIAEFLRIKENIKSPTYTYMSEYSYQRYQNSGNFYHLDVWKIENKKQLTMLELEKNYLSKNVFAIEWFDNIERYFKSTCFLIKIEIETIGENKRKITCHFPE